MKRLIQLIFAFIIILLTVFVGSSFESRNTLSLTKNTMFSSQVYYHDSIVNRILIRRAVTIENYFQFMDSLANRHDSYTPYKLTEHLIVRANPWIIDTLQSTDYYRMIIRDSFVYDQKKMIVLPKGASIIIPDSTTAKKIHNSFQKTIIDINIPEFKLRILKDSVKLYEFPIRVGRNEKKYLEMSGRIQDLKTKTGKGHIVNYVLNPRYVNPVNNHQYFVTKRDDNKVTKLPQIPFIETEINGLRNGQLIHPTTNPITLGKAYSNGCIGTKEADAWVIYYYAPIHTKIRIRYDLKVFDENGNQIVLKDIYNRGR
ncbi:L,D-transpeptidase [Yeosuana sp. MJ-SS3]|uniref:L,D-transpeptidase n=1 Tax=Gilvirhabdus luticola TaxID=3079858 RepID=A0ABU3U5I9_9FLAO|nr:L,D-transpeptidase [Yeosuana sp. MJ-SS3]MDU8885673.1 L,D-transpeptidase [Yeosuana sp. MJ-SS3]